MMAVGELNRTEAERHLINWCEWEGVPPQRMNDNGHV
jgi:hypothetical protein